MPLPSSGAFDLKLLSGEVGNWTPLDLNHRNIRELAGINSGPLDLSSLYGLTYKVDWHVGTKPYITSRMVSPIVGGSNRFATNVAISRNGDVLVVSAESHPVNSGAGLFESGCVFIYRRNWYNWEYETQIINPNAASGNDSFGRYVALSGDGNTLVVGTNNANRECYVFGYDNGSWSLLQTITPNNIANDGLFGFSVDISPDGSWIAVSGPNGGTGSGDTPGKVLLYQKSGSSWSFVEEIYSNDPDNADVFGSRVKFSDDNLTLAVTAWLDDAIDFNTGSAYSFEYNGSNWIETEKITDANTAVGDRLGYDMDLSGDGTLMALGAFTGETAGGLDTGFIYLFEKTGAFWNDIARLNASDGALDDHFGRRIAVSSSGRVLVVASIHSNGTVNDEGAAYVFVRTGAGIVEGPKFIPYNPDSVSMNYGQDVEIDGPGKTIVVTSEYTDSSGDQTGVVETHYYVDYDRILSEEPTSDDYYGYSTAISDDGSTLAVGARSAIENTTNGSVDCGAVYVYKRSGNSWILEDKLFPSDGNTSEWFGSTVALSANGDTLAVGNANLNRYCRVFNRSSGVWSFHSAVTATDTESIGGFSNSIKISQDGTKLLVGAPSSTVSGVISGAVFSFELINGTWTQQQKIVPPTPTANDLFGSNVDVNDAFDVMVTSASRDSSAGTNRGAVHIFNNSGSNWTHSEKITTGSNLEDSDRLGYRVAMSGDGETIAVSTRTTGSGNTSIGSGVVYIYKNISSVWTEITVIQPEDAATSDFFGYSIGISEDGETLVVGSYLDDSQDVNSGSIYIYRISDGVWEQNSELLLDEVPSSEGLGYTMGFTPDGKTIVSTTIHHDGLTNNSGGLYTFDRPH